MNQLTRLFLSAFLLIASVLLMQADPVFAQEKIKVGIIGQFSGPFATAGEEYRQGIESYIALNGTRVGGREVELVYRDVGGPNPAVAKRLAEELIGQDKVAIIGGFFLSPESFAAASVLTQTKTPGVIFNGATPSIVKQSPYFVRVGDTMTQVAEPQAEFALKHGKKRFYLAVADYSPGIATEEAAKAKILAAGGQIVGAERIPMNTVDFAPYAERIANAKPDAVITFLVTGAPAVAALKALSAQGILGNKDIMVIGQAETDDPDLHLFDNSVLGFYSSHVYAAGLENKENLKFKETFKKKFGANTPIGLFVSPAYDGMHVIYKMIESQQGKPFDGISAIAAVQGYAWEGVRGPEKIEADTRDITLNVYIRRVDQVGERKENVVVDTFKARKGS
jgi:branched-chain amino acid transport system substrate-binding protein